MFKNQYWLVFSDKKTSGQCLTNLSILLNLLNLSVRPYAPYSIQYFYTTFVVNIT